VLPDGKFDEEALKEMNVVAQAEEDEAPKEKKSKKKKRKD